MIRIYTLKMLKGFKEFILRGNVVDMAVGVVIGASFGSVVTTLVKGLLTPFISAIARVPDFSGLKFTFLGSVFSYGEFLNALISFVLVAGAIYFFVVLPINKLMSRFSKSTQIEKPATKTCPECLSEIPKLAKRCSHCREVVLTS